MKHVTSGGDRTQATLILHARYGFWKGLCPAPKCLARSTHLCRVHDVITVHSQVERDAKGRGSGAMLQKSLLHFFLHFATCVYFLSKETKASVENCLHFSDRKRCKVSVGIIFNYGNGLCRSDSCTRAELYLLVCEVHLQCSNEIMLRSHALQWTDFWKEGNSFQILGNTARLEFRENSRDRLFIASLLLTGVTSVPIFSGLCSTSG